MAQRDDVVPLRVEYAMMAFGRVAALEHVSAHVRRGELFSTIDPSGAGKAVLLDCVGRPDPPQHGKIIFENHPLTSLCLYPRAALGPERRAFDSRSPVTHG